MITKSAQTLECSTGWQQALANAVREPADLLRRLDLPRSLLPAAERAARQFPLRVPVSYLQRIETGNPRDPLLLQVLPLQDELQSQDCARTDPVGDMHAMTTPGLLHKYHGRALLVTTGACAIHCRYCFRRHFPYNQANPVSGNWPATLDYLRNNSDITEIILSGGDPLNLTDTRLLNMVTDLEKIPHLQTLRLHTRLPVVLPVRVTGALCSILKATRFQTVVVMHINHANEIDASVTAASRQLEDTGSTLLNQSVLLRGVNDHVDTLEALSRDLFTAGILPYYLHQLDPVKGAMHFAVPEADGRRLLAQLLRRLPGYLVPRYVQEISGFGSKIPL